LRVLKEEKKIVRKPLVIGIGGPTGSGKSTFTNMLHQQLKEYKVQIISLDQYFKRPLPKTMAPFTGKEYEDFNHPDSIDWEAVMNQIQISLQASIDILVIEGLLVLYSPEIRTFLDLKIYMDLEAEERMYRRIKRNMAMRGWTLEEIADYYLDSVRFREREFVLPTKWYSDLILNGGQFEEKALPVVTLWIKSNVQAAYKE